MRERREDASGWLSACGVLILHTISVTVDHNYYTAVLLPRPVIGKQFFLWLSFAFLYMHTPQVKAFN